MHIDFAHRARKGFTLIELLIVIAIIAILAAMLMPVLTSARESAMRISCANNLKQDGIGCNVYANDFNDFLPAVALSSSANFYQAALACRVNGIPSSQISAGPFGLGALYFFAGVANPQVFYCPSVLTGEYAFSTYTGPGYPWPSTPANYAYGPNAFIRCGYDYYLQPKNGSQTISLPGGAMTIPAVNFVNLTFTPPNPPGGAPTASNNGSYPEQLKTTQVNLSLAMTVDSLTDWSSVNHKYRAAPYGLNAGFPDGHVRFQSVNGNNKKNSYGPFDQTDLWDPTVPSGPGETAYSSTVPAARIIMAGFKP
jgi:prepilin-type N-terminal cleavage/methylation domain-containing protein